MARKVTRFEVVCDTSLFSAQQLQTRFFGQVGMNGWAQWLREHAVPFRQLVTAYRTGVVVMSVAIEHRRPLTFFDAETVQVEVAVDVIAKGMVRLTSDIYANDEQIVHSWCALKPVLITSADGSLAATPSRIEGALLEYFLPDNYLPDWRPPRLAQEWSQRLLREGIALAEHHEQRAIGRQECEAADQWSFAEVPLIAAASREHLVQGSASGAEKLHDGLSKPLRAVYYEMSRPLFVFDEFSIVSRGYELGGSLICEHTITGATGSRRPNALVVEVFD